MGYQAAGAGQSACASEGGLWQGCPMQCGEALPAPGPWIHEGFSFELIAGHRLFRNLLLPPRFPWSTFSYVALIYSLGSSGRQDGSVSKSLFYKPADPGSSPWTHSRRKELIHESRPLTFTMWCGICKHTHTHIYARAHAHTCTYTCTCIQCTCIHMHAHIHAQCAQMHTHTFQRSWTEPNMVMHAHNLNA